MVWPRLTHNVRPHTQETKKCVRERERERESGVCRRTLSEYV